MQFNRFSNAELERRVYIEPLNAEARVELISRVPALMGFEEVADRLEGVEVDLADAKSLIAMLEEEAEDKDAEIAAGDTVIELLQSQLDESKQSVDHQIAFREKAVNAMVAAACAHGKEVKRLKKRIVELTFAEDLV